MITTMDDIEATNSRRDRQILRPLAYSLFALSILALGAVMLTQPAEAGTCTGYAALEAPLLPQIV